MRDRRPRPLLDDKVLADWNGLMIAAMAMGARVLRRPDLARDAARAADFVLADVTGPDGLLHAWRNGRPPGRARPTTHAAMVWGLLELYAAGSTPAAWSRPWTCNGPWTPDSGTRTGAATSRPRTRARGCPPGPRRSTTGPCPSANALALHNLNRLWRLTGDPALERRARALVRAFAGQVRELPVSHCHFLSGMDLLLGPGLEAVVAGEPDAPDTQALLAALRERYPALGPPWSCAPPEGDPLLDRLVPHAAACGPENGRAAAHVCRDQACSPARDRPHGPGRPARPGRPPTHPPTTRSLTDLHAARTHNRHRKEKTMKRTTLILFACLACLGPA